MAKQRLNPGAPSDFERALASLRPRPTGVDRDQLMFLAGQASVEQPSAAARRWSWIWPASTAISATAALLMGILLAVGQTWPTSSRIAEVAGPNRSSDAAPLPEDSAVAVSQPHSTTTAGTTGRRLDTEPTADSSMALAQLLKLRRTVLTRGVEALPSMDEHHRSDRDGDRTVASTYWSESRRLMARESLEAREGQVSGRFLNWRELFMTGEPL